MSLRVGLVARCDQRGLGIMTRAFHEAMAPAATLAVVMEGIPHTQSPEQYPGATVLRTKDATTADIRVIRRWLTESQLDVVYSAETFYNPAFVQVAHSLGVPTVLHVMPEFWGPSNPVPSVVWNPTSWRNETLPGGTARPGQPAEVMPVPIEEPPFRRRPVDGPLRVVHVAGQRAHADRNGTDLFALALRQLRPDEVRVRIELQAGAPPRVPSWVEVVQGRQSRWELFSDADVLVMPRRYAGLSLPVQEALATGLAVAMTDCSPNRGWPVIPLPARPGGTFRGIQMYDANPALIAATIRRLAADRAELEKHAAASLAWAQAYSWPEMRTRYGAALAVIAGRPQAYPGDMSEPTLDERQARVLTVVDAHGEAFLDVRHGTDTERATVNPATARTLVKAGVLVEFRSTEGYAKVRRA